MIYEKTGKRPIVLLDDVFSELDETREDLAVFYLSILWPLSCKVTAQNSQQGKKWDLARWILMTGRAGPQQRALGSPPLLPLTAFPREDRC